MSLSTKVVLATVAVAGLLAVAFVVNLLLAS
jgi:hypothetical protein